MKPFSKLPISRMHKNLAPTVLALAAAFGFGQPAAALTIGSGHVIAETRNVSGFHALELEGDGSVIITQGSTEGLSVEAEDNILPLIRTEVDGKGVLHLGYKNQPHGESIETKKSPVFKVSAKMLDSFVLEGSGSISADTLTVADHGKFAAALPGSGKVTVDKLTAGSVKASVEGSGDIKLGGEANDQVVSIDGSGKYLAADLKTHTAKVQIDGSGDAKISASDDLKIEVNGSGDIGYYGNPKVQKSINGSGSVKALGEPGR